MNTITNILKPKESDLIIHFDSMRYHSKRLVKSKYITFSERMFENFILHSDEKIKVEGAILELLNKNQPQSLLNIGAGAKTR